MPTVTDRPVDAPGRARAWGWVAHLRGGGTAPWTAWRDGGADGVPTGGWLPGAQQLELLRRLNRAGRPGPALVDRVLGAGAVGRGRHDLELVGAAEPSRFGPEPVDPGDLPAEDLLRVATGLLARALLATDSAAVRPGGRAAATPTRRRVRRVRTRYRLVGDPALAGPPRAALVADGRPPGGQGAAVLVLGADLATMLGHAWVSGAFAEGGPSWPDYLGQWQRRGRLPRRIDLPAVADRWRAAPGTGRVDVVLDLARLPALVGLRRGRTLPDPPTVSATAAELARRTATALGLLVAPDERDRLLGTVLRPRLEAAPGPGPVVPPADREWVEDGATRMRRRILAAGHPVVGDVDRLRPSWAGGEAPAGAAPLDLAVRLLLEGVEA